MLNWILMVFAITLTACTVGYGGIIAGVAGIAKALFLIFLILIAISFAAHKGSTPRT